MTFVLWVFMDMTPSVYRRDRTRSEILAQQGKPVTLPETAGEPQGTLLTLRVKEYGKSERLSVMDGIRTPALTFSLIGVS
jgi:RNA-directed DNA polymerase